jgi:hypothetical protein
MVSIISNTDFAHNLVFVIDNVSSIDKMADLVVTLSNDANGIDKVGLLINGIDDTGNNGAAPYGNTFNPAAGSRGAATEAGKLVNMVDYTDSLSAVANILMDVADVNKMITLVNDVANSSNLVGVLNAVIRDDNAVNVSTADLVAVVNGISAANDVAKLVAIINHPDMTPATELAAVTNPGDEHQLMADLMAPIAAATQGIGSGNMITLISATGSCSSSYYTQASCTGNGGTWNAADTAPAERLAEVMANLNNNLCYNESCGAPTTSRREGLVRMVSAGVVYWPAEFNEIFPGLGAAHLALMMNQAQVQLHELMNATDLADVVVVVGCGDRVSGFDTACTNIGEGW